MSLVRRNSMPESSIPDENISDLIAGGLYLREWMIVGTPPPSPNSTTLEHLVMNYHQAVEGTDEDEVREIHGRRPIALDRDTQFQIEEIPAREETLGEYSEYFKSCVTTSKLDMLLNVCRIRKKSPCVDIPGCLIVKPNRDISAVSNDYCKTKVGDQDCILMIPQTTIDNIMENVAYLGKYILSVPHDAWPYNSSRIRMSQLYTDFDLQESDWDYTSSYIKDLRRYVSCRAVSTATLTVTFVLGMCYGKHSYYGSRRSLSIVVHAIK